jgi:hypothetical protein
MKGMLLRVINLIAVAWHTGIIGIISGKAIPAA